MRKSNEVALPERGDERGRSIHSTYQVNLHAR